MASEPLRFVQSSDLLIDRPLGALASSPDDLRELLRDAPRLAAERVFDTALSEEADALLLPGNVVDLTRAAPRDLVFLTNQFERLGKRGVRVFWAGGKLDPPDLWPRSMPLPDNVTVFPTGRVEEHSLYREDELIAVIQGTSYKAETELATHSFHKASQAPFTAAVVYSPAEPAEEEAERVDYLALGGRSRRTTIDRQPGLAHYAGCPQGCNPKESGQSGCSVVQIDESGRPKTRLIATDLIRWCEETVEFTAGVSAEQLTQRLRERLDKITSRSKGVDQLVSWRLHGVGPLVAQLHADGLCKELLTDLQTRVGRQKPMVWSYSVTCDDAYEPPHEQLDQETILGDLLRQVEVLRRNEAFGLDLKELLPRPLAAPEMKEMATIATSERADLYNRAAKLGVALMTEDGD